MANRPARQPPPDPDDFAARLEAALRHTAPAAPAVRLDTEDGEEYLLEHGTLHIPADTPLNRLRAEVTRACARCPSLNQAMRTSERNLGAGGSYLVAEYLQCGHAATLLLSPHQRLITCWAPLRRPAAHPGDPA